MSVSFPYPLPSTSSMTIELVYKCVCVCVCLLYGVLTGCFIVFFFLLPVLAVNMPGMLRC